MQHPWRAPVRGSGRVRAAPLRPGSLSRLHGSCAPVDAYVSLDAIVEAIELRWDIRKRRVEPAAASVQRGETWHGEEDALHPVLSAACAARSAVILELRRRDLR